MSISRSGSSQNRYILIPTGNKSKIVSKVYAEALQDQEINRKRYQLSTWTGPQDPGRDR